MMGEAGDVLPVSKVEGQPAMVLRALIEALPDRALPTMEVKGPVRFLTHLVKRLRPDRLVSCLLFVILKKSGVQTSPEKLPMLENAVP